MRISREEIQTQEKTIEIRMMWSRFVSFSN